MAKKQSDTGIVKTLLAMPEELKSLADQLASDAGRNLSSYLRYLIIKAAYDKDLITPDLSERLIDSKI